MFVLQGRPAPNGGGWPWEHACIAHGSHEGADGMPRINVMEAALPRRGHAQAGLADESRPPPSPSAQLAWPPGELERWLREHDDSQPQADAALLSMRLPHWEPVRRGRLWAGPPRASRPRRSRRAPRAPCVARRLPAQASGLLTLDFFQRASCASPRNFQLTAGEGEPGRPVLLFGQTSEHSYSLDFGAPLSPFAAFGIALSAHVSW